MDYRCKAESVGTFQVAVRPLWYKKALMWEETRRASGHKKNEKVNYKGIWDLVIPSLLSSTLKKKPEIPDKREFSSRLVRVYFILNHRVSQNIKNWCFEFWVWFYQKKFLVFFQIWKWEREVERRERDLPSSTFLLHMARLQLLLPCEWQCPSVWAIFCCLLTDIVT